MHVLLMCPVPCQLFSTVTANLWSEGGSSRTGAENLSSISSAQNELKDPARLENAARSRQSDALSCLEVVLQGESLCGCTTVSLVAPRDKVTWVV